MERCEIDPIPREARASRRGPLRGSPSAGAPPIGGCRSASRSGSARELTLEARGVRCLRGHCGAEREESARDASFQLTSCSSCAMSQHGPLGAPVRCEVCSGVPWGCSDVRQCSHRADQSACGPGGLGATHRARIVRSGECELASIAGRGSSDQARWNASESATNPAWVGPPVDMQVRNHITTLVTPSILALGLAGSGCGFGGLEPSRRTPGRVVDASVPAGEHQRRVVLRPQPVRAGAPRIESDLERGVG